MKEILRNNYEMEVIVSDFDSSTIGKNLLKDHENFSDLTSKVISSLFLICTPTDALKSYFLILKPESLWLKQNTEGQGLVKDVFGKVDDKIASYSLYQAGDIIKIEFLEKNITALSVLQSLVPGAISLQTPSFPDLNQFTDIKARDKNLRNKGRFATSNNNSEPVNFILPTWL